MKYFIVYDRQRYIGNERFGLLLGKALRKRGHDCSVAMADSVDLSEGADGVIMRTYDPDFSMTLKEKGIRSFNNARTQSTGNDKAATYAFARSMGIPIPETHIVRHGEEPPLGTPFVLKSRFGHGGNEVFMIENNLDYRTCSDKIKEVSFLVQKPMEPGRDKRVYVIGNTIIAAFMRVNTSDFRSNYKLGGRASPAQVNRVEEEYVRRVCGGLRPDFIGVDFLYEKGVPYLNEIEDIVGSRMVYENSDIDILDLYAEYIVRETSAKHI